MTRIVKNIQLFLLFTAATVYYAHMLIPHDHHQAESDACLENTRPKSHNGANHHRGFPVHCHAFNDITPEKAISFVIVKYDKYADFMPGCILNSDVSDLPSFSIIFSGVCNLPVNSGIPRFSSLRAPPTIG